MNRDTREIVRLYDVLGRANHARVIREPLNAAAMLCEDFCIAAAGFIVEDEIAFELFEAQAPYLKTGLFQLPIRERSLADFAEKKRGEYAPARSRYSGLFDDSRMMYLSSLGEAIVSRKVQIGPSIIAGFEEGVDTKSEVWRGIRQRAPTTVIESIRSTPGRLAEQGKALTWSIMQPHFIREASLFGVEMRDALQHVYFKEYCSEFRLIVLSDIPYITEVFYLPTIRKVYSFRRFKGFLSAIGAVDVFLNASAEFITNLRRTAGFIELMDAYVGMAGLYLEDNALRYHTARAVEAGTFKWSALAARREGFISDPTVFETIEIADGCAELAGRLTHDHGLPTRVNVARAHAERNTGRIVRGMRMKVLLFVALEEELEVLVGRLNLKRGSTGPAAAGTIGEVDIDVLCPREMGRVAAAIETTEYLSKATRKPDLILCVGLAGGIGEEGIVAGMVICADTVVDLANRKVIDDDDGMANSKFRRRDFACCRQVYSVARTKSFDEAEWESFCRKEFGWPKGRIPSLHEGKIASTDEVISSNDHRKKLLASGDKLLCVEMEAGGVCASAERFNVPVAVIRVVSDGADPAKEDDRWRRSGMQTLAELVKRLPLTEIIANSRKT